MGGAYDDPAFDDPNRFTLAAIADARTVGVRLISETDRDPAILLEPWFATALVALTLTVCHDALAAGASDAEAREAVEAFAAELVAMINGNTFQLH